MYFEVTKYNKMPHIQKTIIEIKQIVWKEMIKYPFHQSQKSFELCLANAHSFYALFCSFAVKNNNFQFFCEILFIRFPCELS